MRTVTGAFVVTTVAVGLAYPCAAQVINGESTADSGYSKAPPAAWSPPSGRPEPSEIDPQDERDDGEDGSRRNPGLR